MKNKKRWMVLLAAGVLTVNGMAVTAVAEDTTENATENATEESTEGLTVDPDEAGSYYGAGRGFRYCSICRRWDTSQQNSKGQ